MLATFVRPRWVMAPALRQQRVSKQQNRPSHVLKITTS
jgi:hypothetical protein